MCLSFDKINQFERKIYEVNNALSLVDNRKFMLPTPDACLSLREFNSHLENTINSTKEEISRLSHKNIEEVIIPDTSHIYLAPNLSEMPNPDFHYLSPIGKPGNYLHNDFDMDA